MEDSELNLKEFLDSAVIDSVALMKARQDELQKELWIFTERPNFPTDLRFVESVKLKLREIKGKIMLVEDKLRSGQLSAQSYLEYLQKLLPTVSSDDVKILSSEIEKYEALIQEIAQRCAKEAARAKSVATIPPSFSISAFTQTIEPAMWKVRLADGAVRTHTFVEKTFKTFTHCMFCTTMNLVDGKNRTSFIAGVYKQGLQCSLCRYPVHKHCLPDCEAESLCGGESLKDGKLDAGELRSMRRQVVADRFLPTKNMLLQLYTYSLASKDLQPLTLFLSSCTDLKYVALDMVTNKRQLNGMLLAVEAGATALVELLLTHSADINATNADGLSPLLQAAWSGNKDLVSLFLACGANTLQHTRKGSTALTLAIESGHVEIVKQLIQAGMLINNLDESVPFSPLMVSIMSGQMAVACVLLELNADVEQKTVGGVYDGFSALFYACLTGEDTLVQTMLKLKANPNSRTRDGFTPLMVAAQKGRTNCVVALGRVAELDHTTISGDTALMWAVYRRQWEVVGTLVSLGATVAGNKRHIDAARVAKYVNREREFNDAVATAHIYRAISILSLVLIVAGYRGLVNDLVEDHNSKSQAFERSFVFRGTH